MMDKITVGDTRAYTWVNSGVTPTSILHKIYLRDTTLPGSGTEILVSSKAGVSSGNGHYYSLVLVNTPGYFVSEWSATVDSNTYKERFVFQADAKSIDKSNRYIDWGDIVAMYPQVGKGPDAAHVSAYHIPFAEAEVDGLLSGFYTTPFSSTNLTVRELTINAAYLRLGITTDKTYDVLKKRFDERIKRLQEGKEFMLVSSDNGHVAAIDRTSALWSSTMDNSPTFNMLPTELQSVSSSQLWSELDGLN